MEKFKNEFLKIRNNITSRNETKELNKYFIKKKLKTNTVLFLINNQIEIEDLDINEKIALCKGLYDLGYESMNPSIFFTPSQLLDFETLVVKEEYTNIIEFNDVSRYNDDSFIVTAWKPSKLVTAWKNRNIRYNFDSQRQAILSVDRWGNVTYKMNINRESVNEIKKLIKEKKYFPPDMLTFNILQLEDKEPFVKYNEKTKKLTIKIDSDFDSPNTTFFDIIDGAHRTLALVELYDEGVDVDNIFLGFPVQISIITVDQALEFIYRQSKANKQNEEFLEQKIDDKYKKFIDKVASAENSETNILFDNISDSYEKMRIDKKLTYVGVLKSALRMIEEKMNVNFDSRAELNFGSKQVVDIINTIVEILKEEKKEYIYKNNFNIYFGFFIAAYSLRINKISEDESFDILFKVVQNIIDNEDYLKKLKLNTLSFPKKTNYDFFINILEGSDFKDE